MRLVTSAVVIHCVLFGIGMAVAFESSVVPYRLIGEVGPSIFAEFDRTPAIMSFNMSPDGTRLVLLYESGKGQAGIPGNDELWIALWDIAGKKIVERMKLADNDLVVPIHGSDPKGPIFDENYLFSLKLRTDVIFSADQAYIVAMGFGKVWVLDAKTLSIARPLKFHHPDPVAPLQIQAVAGYVVAATSEYEYQQFEVDLFDLSTGNRVTTWTSPTAPQSFSPDGNLAVAPALDAVNSGGITNLAVLNAQTGAKVKSIPVGFAFKKGWLGKEVARGSVVARFLSDDEVVVIPDGNRDAAGHHAGYSLEIIDIVQGRVVRNLHPEKFGPTGVLTESSDRSHYLVESFYASPIWFAIESSNPKHFSHQLMVFAKGSITPEAVVPYPTPKAADYRFPVLGVPPRLSADGSTMAVGVADNVQVLRLKR